jgi:2-oxoglutarate dehydrogenase E2 component (dihydrolipoamide succinyltransferase)
MISSRCFGSAGGLYSAIRRSFSIEAVKLPSLGESVTEGSVQSWLKKKGDFVKEDEVVVAIESDKMG